MTVVPMPTAPPREHRGPLSTQLGKVWARRIRGGERNYERAKARFAWAELRKLYLAEAKRAGEWGTNVSMAWSVLQNLVADSFFKNPEPNILPLNPQREDEARMLTDLGRSWHEIAGTEDNVMRARVLCGLQGGAVIWLDEDSEYEDAVALDGGGEPMVDEVTGEALYELGDDGMPLQEAIRQEFRQRLVDLHGIRFDPDGRNWDWTDMKWVEIRYERSLQSFLDDATISDKSKAMLRAHAKSSSRRRANWDRGRDGNETDPNYQMVDCGAVWSMTDGKIYHIPVGAEFHLEGATEETSEGFPMPAFWRRLKKYPGQMFAYNWAPPDEDGLDGFYPVPDLFLVKDNLKNLNRLEGLILNLCMQQTTKHLIQDGIADTKVQRRLQSDVPRELIPVDFLPIMKRFAQAGVNLPANFEHLLVNLKTDQREQLIKHFEAFEHEVNLIRETLSQGPAQRGGVTDSKTATGQLQVGQALERRLEIEGERTSAYIDGLTERFFILLQNRGTLPFYYRDSSTKAEAFRPFVATQEFRDLKLSFRHRTGSARGIDRELLRGQIREAITNALPVVQDPTVIQTMLGKLFATFDDPTLQDLFKNDMSGLAEEAASVMAALDADQITLEQAGPALMNFLGAFINAHLTQAGVDRVAQKIAGGAPPAPQAERSASAEKPKSAGKKAFDKAAGLANAGRVGGIAQ